MAVPRPEYPRPDFVREEWINLNGTWRFAEDYNSEGRSNGIPNDMFGTEITVPFCRESRLSGLEHRDFCNCVWYRRTVDIPERWEGKRVILHIGACDWKTEVWVNGVSAGTHKGGYVSFSFDITDKLVRCTNEITICAEDDIRTGMQASGKQSPKPESFGCLYTRTTGIWQTVWLECVPQNYVKGMRVFPDISEGTVTLEFEVCGSGKISAEAYYQGKKEGAAVAETSAGSATLTIKPDDLYLWEIRKGRLYDLKIAFGEDRIDSCFGMRSVCARDGYLYINGKRIFQRLVLDQGYYPDGVYTAPSDADLTGDIQRALDCGFDGARLHQKVFEPRFLHHCDEMGYIVWGEYPNWGMDCTGPEAWENCISEWKECLRRDFSHPAIIGWCPLNETGKDQDDSYVEKLASVTREYDSTRPYIDTSGWCHIEGLSDIVDSHDYEQDPAAFGKKYDDMRENGTPVDCTHSRFAHGTTFVSEYGGMRLDAGDDPDGWGYGDVKSAEFTGRFKALSDVLLDNPAIGGFCYTQLTDVEQEMNGLYTYARQPKSDPAVFYRILQRKSAAEEGDTNA